MPDLGTSLTLTTSPQRIARPSPRPYTAVGVANTGSARVVIAVGANQWPIPGGFQAIIPLPGSEVTVTGYTQSGTSPVDVAWYLGEDITSVERLRSSLVNVQTGTITSATSLGTVAVSSIEQPVLIGNDSSQAVPITGSVTVTNAASAAVPVEIENTVSNPIPVSLQSTADYVPALNTITGTVATANTYQLVASTQNVLLAAVLSNTGADSLSWGITDTDTAPSAATFVQASGAAPIVIPAQIGLGGPVYLWVTSATAGAAFGAVWAAS